MKFTESAHQIALIEWARYNPILKRFLFKVGNGGRRSLIAGARAKREGELPGVSDLFLAYPVGHYHGCWLELKSPEKWAKLSTFQREWLLNQYQLGYCAGVCYGADEAMKYLSAYLNYDTIILESFHLELTRCLQ